MGWSNDDDIQEETEEENDSMSENSSVGNDPKEAPKTMEKGEKPDSGVDPSSLAPNAMNIEEAVQKERQHTIMAWSNEGQGKTHFGYTMPEPVCFIDTENKADDIADKFSDKEVYIWQPKDFDEACQHRDEALNFLSEYMSKTGERGTIVIDSMAVMWEWSQYKFIEEWYPNTPPEDVNIELQDWPKIKEYHNKHFRKPLESCDFHVYWTSTRKDDVGAVINNDDIQQAPDKPGGEGDNVYKVNSIIRLYLDQNGVPAGDLQKSGFTRFKYIGLERPTFPKHVEILNEIQEAEKNGADTASEIEESFSLDYDIKFTEANTLRFLEDD
jgi:hypothetical protein